MADNVVDDVTKRQVLSRLLHPWEVLSTRTAIDGETRDRRRAVSPPRMQSDANPIWANLPNDDPIKPTFADTKTALGTRSKCSQSRTDFASQMAHSFDWALKHIAITNASGEGVVAARSVDTTELVFFGDLVDPADLQIGETNERKSADRTVSPRRPTSQMLEAMEYSIDIKDYEEGTERSNSPVKLRKSRSYVDTKPAPNSLPPMPASDFLDSIFGGESKKTLLDKVPTDPNCDLSEQLEHVMRKIAAEEEKVKVAKQRLSLIKQRMTSTVEDKKLTGESIESIDLKTRMEDHHRKQNNFQKDQKRAADLLAEYEEKLRLHAQVEDELKTKADEILRLRREQEKQRYQNDQVYASNKLLIETIAELKTEITKVTRMHDELQAKLIPPPPPEPPHEGNFRHLHSTLVEVLLKKKQYEETEKIANRMVHATHHHHRAREALQEEHKRDAPLGSSLYNMSDAQAKAGIEAYLRQEKKGQTTQPT